MLYEVITRIIEICSEGAKAESEIGRGLPLENLVELLGRLTASAAQCIEPSEVDPRTDVVWISYNFV